MVASRLFGELPRPVALEVVFCGVTLRLWIPNGTWKAHWAKEES